ncbi:MAG: hypothetical protein K2K02_04950 [Ruminococcus sp.]|nr:hypothetical protein [Ruminococcus sp.]
MKNKKITAFLASIAMCATAMVPTLNTSAADTYSNGFYRGVRYVSYVETDFYWYVDNRYNITDSSAYQWCEGLQAVCGGATRIYTNPLEHDYAVSSKVAFGVGALSYTVNYNDTIALSNSGSSWIIGD